MKMRKAGGRARTPGIGRSHAMACVSCNCGGRVIAIIAAVHRCFHRITDKAVAPKNRLTAQSCGADLNVKRGASSNRRCYHRGAWERTRECERERVGQESESESENGHDQGHGTTYHKTLPGGPSKAPPYLTTQKEHTVGKTLGATVNP